MTPTGSYDNPGDMLLTTLTQLKTQILTSLKINSQSESNTSNFWRGEECAVNVIHLKQLKKHDEVDFHSLHNFYEQMSNEISVAKLDFDCWGNDRSHDSKSFMH